LSLVLGELREMHAEQGGIWIPLSMCSRTEECTGKRRWSWSVAGL
jgi:hypothetical protein